MDLCQNMLCRGQDPMDNKYYYGYYYYDAINKIHWIINPRDIKDMHVVSEKSIDRFTGFFDKNNIPIFENDDFKDKVHDKDVVCTIKYDPTDAIFEVICSFNSNDMNSYLSYSYSVSRSWMSEVNIMSKSNATKDTINELLTP